MGISLNDDLRREYQNLFDTCVVTPAGGSAANSIVAKIMPARGGIFSAGPSLQRSERRKKRPRLSTKPMLPSGKRFFGFAAAARELAHAALSGWKGRDVEYGAALGLALANNARGEQTGIANLANDLAKRFPDDTLGRFNYLPTLRAQIALNRDQSSQAIEGLQASVPYQLGTPEAYGFPQALLPVYVRGEAYLAAHRGPEAAAEFQMVLNHRGIVFNEPIGALAHLGLARAYAIQAAEASDNNRPQLRANARSAYEDFLKLWKEADPNVPLLAQVHAEYDRLK